MLLILIFFIVGIVVCYFLAIAIRKYVPEKFLPFISIILYGLVIFIGYITYNSVMEPIHFKKEKVKRYTEVIKSLKIVRDAQAAHRTVIGSYCANGDDLIKFIDTAQFAVTRDTNMLRTVDVGGNITKEEEYRVTDTIGYTDVRAAFVGRAYKDMMKVPGTDSLFTMEIGLVQKAHGDMRKAYQVKVSKSLVLKGMNDDLIRQEEEAIENDQVKGTHIVVGSLSDVTTNGNWPPSYDVGDVKKK